jgi:hypothetical protein
MQSGIFATVDANGKRTLVNEIILRQTDSNAEFAGKNAVGQPGDTILPAALVDNSIVVGRPSGDAVYLWGTNSDIRLEGFLLEDRADRNRWE